MMRLYGNLESANSCDVTLFSIIETLICILASISLIAVTGSTAWMAIAATFSPLLLLRNPRSDELALRYFASCYKAIQDFHNAWFVLYGKSKYWFLFDPSGLIALCIILLAVILKFISIVVSLTAHPLDVVRGITRNWFRVVACTDFMVLPELIPGIEAHNKAHEESHLPCATDALAILKNPKAVNLFSQSASDKKIYIAVFIAFYPSLILPQFYRCSFKATSLVWFPLLYISWRGSRRIQDTYKALKLASKGVIPTIVVVSAVVIVLLFLAKLSLFVGVNEFASWLERQRLGNVLTAFVVPRVLPPWQVASFINAILTLGFIVFCKTAIVRHENGSPWSEKVVKPLVRGYWFTNSLLSLYTTICTLYIAWEVSSLVDWPPLEDRIFPWQ